MELEKFTKHLSCSLRGSSFDGCELTFQQRTFGTFCTFPREPSVTKWWVRAGHALAMCSHISETPHELG